MNPEIPAREPSKNNAVIEQARQKIKDFFHISDEISDPGSLNETMFLTLREHFLKGSTPCPDLPEKLPLDMTIAEILGISQEVIQRKHIELFLHKKHSIWGRTILAPNPQGGEPIAIPILATFHLYHPEQPTSYLNIDTSTLHIASSLGDAEHERILGTLTPEMRFALLAEAIVTTDNALKNNL